jgi:hypothetical protein
MQRRWFTLLCGIALAAMLTVLVGQRPVVGQDDRGEGEHRKLAGTWNVTLKFPDTGACAGPGGVPNIPIPALQTYLKGGSILEVGGFSSIFRGPGLGSWEHLGQQQFVARFKFFLFNPNGTGRGSEVVTSHIDLTGPNAFEAAATFDVLDTAGNLTAAQGCHINETATRFE